MIRFVLVGGSATLFQFVLLFSFVEFGHFNKIFASALSFAIAAILNYLLNYYFTFASEKSHFETASKFIVVATIGLLINSTSFALLLVVMPHYLFAQIGATLLALSVNFLLHKIWIYRS
ncbi:MAG TPA: GtrA family protein [Edaphocola sp.]|nr:GtrA family protein [Edaphocola sp.]